MLESTATSDTFGKWHYGLSWQFAWANTSADLKNLVNEEHVKAMERRTPVRNSLDKDMQWRLHNKVVPFTASDAYMKTVFKGGHKAGEGWKKAATAENGKALRGLPFCGSNMSPGLYSLVTHCSKKFCNETRVYISKFR